MSLKESEEFVANGHTYQITDRLSLERYMEYEKLQIRVGFGVSFKEVFEELKEIYDLVDKMKFANSAVRLHNLMRGVVDKEDEKADPMLMLCTLFINRKGEDRKVYDEKLSKEKISDWVKEGFDVQDFFSLAKTLVNGFTPIYNELSQNTSDKTKEEKNKK